MQKKNILKRDWKEISPETNMGAVITADEKNKNKQNNLHD